MNIEAPEPKTIRDGCRGLGAFCLQEYSGKSGTISWFMPLHIDAPLSEDPELVMVVRRSGDFYEIKTILSYDDELKDRITALSLYSKLW